MPFEDMQKERMLIVYIHCREISSSTIFGGRQAQAEKQKTDISHRVSPAGPMQI